MAENIVLSVKLDGASEALAQLTQLDQVLAHIKANRNVKISVNSKSLATAANNAQTLNTNLTQATQNAKTLGTSGARNVQNTGKSLQVASRNAESFRNGIGSTILTMAKFRIASAAINLVATGFKDAFKEMKNVDSEMVTIRKVTGYAADQMARLSNNAYSLASKYGRTASEVMSGESVFARAGYTDQIEQLGELNLLLQNVGDISADSAASFIIATDAAYRFGGSQEKLMAVIDGLNEITNRHATDMGKMTEGMTIAGSVFAESGESIETFAALLGTATAATQRSGSEMARGLRTILMNLRQIRGETEDGELIDGESIAAAAKALKDYANISTMENGKLRKASDVLADLASKWATLDETQRSAISEAIAGKRQANILMALMGNWGTYQQMLGDYAAGAGSALKENEIYLESWAAKVNQIKASWTELVSSIVSTDFIKQVLSGVFLTLEDINSLFDPEDERIRKAQDKADVASANAKNARAQFERDYGEGSRYDELRSKIESLTEAEKVELGILEAQRAERERLIQLAEEEEKRQQKKVEDERNKPIDARNKTASHNGDYLSNRVSKINDNFLQTKDVNAYARALATVVSEYEDYYVSLIKTKRAGTELTEQEQAFAEGFELLAKIVGEGGEAADVFGKAAAAAARASGDTAAKAVEAGNDAVQQINLVTEAINNIPSAKDVSINVSVNGIALGGSGGLSGALADITGKLSGAFSGAHFASGTKGAPGGPALVNENGPEMISANGLAWIAGGGKPTVTMLPKGATVLTAQQTRRATGGRKISGIPAFEDGIDAIAGWVPSKEEYDRAKEDNPLTIQIFNGPSTEPPKVTPPHGRRPKVEPGDPNREPLKGYKYRSRYGYWEEETGPLPPDFKALEEELTKRLKNLDAQAELAENEEDFVKALMVYGEAQDAIAELLEQYRANGYAEDSDEVLRLANMGYDYAHKQLGDYDELQERLVDALNALTEATDKANALQERQEAVDKAREALRNAESQRTVRIFNPVTGQWEWVANASDVERAREDLKSAEEDLTREQIDQTIDAIQNAKPEDLAGMTLTPAVLDKLFNGTPEQQSAFLNALNAATGGADYLGSAEGQTAWNQGASIGTQYNLNGITLTEAQAAGMSIKELLDMLRGLKVMT